MRHTLDCPDDAILLRKFERLRICPRITRIDANALVIEPLNLNDIENPTRYLLLASVTHMPPATWLALGGIKTNLRGLRPP